MREPDDEMTWDGFWKAVTKYGLPSVVALALGYILIGEVRADQKQMMKDHAALVVEQGNLARGILKVADTSRDTQRLQEQILRVLQVTCLQNAVTNRDKSECLREQ
jgi:hypothetical protein